MYRYLRAEDSRSDGTRTSVKVLRSMIDCVFCVLYSCVSGSKVFREDPAPRRGFKGEDLSAGNSINATERSDWPARVDKSVVPITCHSDLYRPLHVYGWV